MNLRRLGVIAATVAVVASGCASHGPNTRITTLPSTPAAVPSVEGAQTLPSMGFTYGPPELRFPADLVVDRRIDQANVVTVFFKRPKGVEAATWFRTELPRAGFTIGTDANNSLLFSGPQWSGAMTTAADGTTGFTLRREG